MASRTIHDKIPHNVRVNKRNHAADQVVGVRAVNPSVAGIAEKRRAAAMKRVRVAADAIGSLFNALDSDDAGASELAKKLMSNSQFRAALSKALGEIHSDLIEAPFKEQERTSSKARNEAYNERLYPEATEAAREKEQAAAATDSAWTAWTPEAIEKRAADAAKLARVEAVLELGEPADRARVMFGRDPLAYDSDAMHRLMDRLEGKTR